ncbi:MAG: ABC transporter ATP-binding protein [Cyanobacterium sp. T60_A2020_053]|nr:ABC transporter ATP-binding protein [Cyanobacterium sp. T60_A2020_053]
MLVIIENLYKSYTSPRQQTTTPIDIPSEETKPTPNDKKDTHHILKGINLTIQQGEFMVLVGPSGCGKSTLLRLIAGLEEITAGNIIIAQQKVNDLPPKARDIAMVFQNYALYPHLTVYDNIAFGLRRMNQNSPNFTPANILANLSRALPSRWRYFSPQEQKINAQVQKVAELLQIDHLLDRLPKQLSGGQKQRVALGRAIARNPQAFLMDEPLSNLDAKLRMETRGQIVQLQKQLQVTTIYVTHDQVEAMTMGDRIAIMNQGEIQQVDTPLQVYRQPANKFVAQFIGSPPMNFLLVNYHQPNIIKTEYLTIKLTEKWQSILANYHYEKVWLGIRPEHFFLAQSSDQTIAIKVNLVESLGNETIIYGQINSYLEQELQVKIFGDQSVKIGEIIYLEINWQQVHFFDFYQEKNLQQ